MQINLGQLYQELQAELRAAELCAAELRGQITLIERLIADARAPQLSGDPLDTREETTNGNRPGGKAPRAGAAAHPNCRGADGHAL
jgi:hypothetical protein